MIDDLLSRRVRRLAVSISLLAIGGGCDGPNATIYTATATIIGVDISQNANQVPQGTLGYKRAEFAIVPTDIGQCVYAEDKTLKCPSDISAKNAPNVLMELHYPGIFTGGGIYQRLAVGEKAVSQPGAALLFAKDAGGKVDAAAANAIEASALAAGKVDAKLYLSTIDRVSACVSPGGNFQKEKVAAIVDQTDLDALTAGDIKSAETAGALQTKLKIHLGSLGKLASAINANESVCQ